MSRRTRYDQSLPPWPVWRRSRRARLTTTRPHTRRLHLEPLEDRRMLDGVTVSNDSDLVNGDTNTIALLIASDGGDGISLREAILAANANAGADEVTFAAAFSGQTITLLDGMELVITEALAIDARPLAVNVTIDAGELSRIFNITANSGDFMLGGLTLTGGRTTGSGSAGAGGAIRSLTTGTLTIDQSTISGNSTAGIAAQGGGISAEGDMALTQSTVGGNSTTGNTAKGGGISAEGDVTLTQSTVSGNSTMEPGSVGGGIAAYGNVTLNQSTVSGNNTAGTGGSGGGIAGFNGTVMLNQSTVIGNHTSGQSANGGGISTSGAVTLNQSTVSGNSSTGGGGGIYTQGAVTLNQSTVSGNDDTVLGGGMFARDVTLTQSTVSGNSSPGDGGGIFSIGAVTLTQSTVTNNHAGGSMGGGVYQFNGAFDLPISISSSIVAGNTASGGGPDLFKDPGSTLTVNDSVIGTGIVPNAGGNNVATNNPQLAPLTNNGGPTQTHATLAASPAINAGDPSIMPNPAEFDQRGGPFVRVFGGRIDAGAYERQTVAGLNLVVDALADTYDLDFSAGQLSLREAIGLANGMLGDDTITFAAAMSGATIALGGTEIEISESLTIDARPLARNVTIDAQELSRVFIITATTGNFTLGGLMISGGRTTADSSPGSGGAIRSLTTGSLAFDQSTISGSRTTGSLAGGGGIYSLGSVMLTESTVSGNSTAGVFSNGGGIHSIGSVTLARSTVSGNSTEGPNTPGGGISAADVTLTQSTISENSVMGSGSQGGAFRANGVVTLTQSTVSGNNSGIFLYDGFGSSATITGSILAGNGTDFASSVPNPMLFLTADYSLIGTQVSLSVGANNVVTDDPMLGPFAFNGGPTQTRALLDGSLAMDAGDPAIDFDPTEFDQRGSPLVRVFDGDGADGARIDIGAFEAQPILPAAFGDYNEDGIVNAADYVLWRNTEGDTVTPFSGADGNGNGVIDDGDYQVWRDNYGNTLPPGAGAGSAVGSANAVTAEAVTANPEPVFIVPGEAASAAGRLPRSRSLTPLAPTTIDHALLVLLTNQDRQRNVTEQFDAPAKSSQDATTDASLQSLTTDIALTDWE